MTTLSLDFETASLVDLRKVGAYVYAQHPSTEVLCMAWAFDNEPVQVWRRGQLFPARVSDHVERGGEVHGWNVIFEYLIWNHVLWNDVLWIDIELTRLELDQLHCTMARAACWGAPMKLDQAGTAVGAPFVKDRKGHDLMLRMCRPRSYDPATSLPVWWHETDAAKYDRLCDYCARDVETERAIAARLPNMPPWEREIWLMDARMNQRGFRLDAVAVHSLHALATQEVGRLDQKMRTLTSGLVPSTSNVGALTRYAKGFGFGQKGLANDIIEDLLTGLVPIPDELRAALETRQQARKTSTKKLVAMLACCPPDERVRGLFQYAGAPRTLRWAGRLIQPQNLPRPMKGLDPEMVIEAVLNGADAETLAQMFGDPMDVIASCLRSCFQAGEDRVFAVCDYSAIEARVIAWLAGQKDILEVFARKEDVYKFTAKAIGSTDRQLGKVLVLACGFGMGAVKFKATAETYGISLSDADAQMLVALWRTANSHVVRFWYALDAAARDAINHPGHAYKVGLCTVRMGRHRMRRALMIELPNGSFLSYRDARLEWEDGRENITFWGVDAKTKQWSKQRTYGGKLAENVTQSLARHLLADAMLRCESARIPLVGTIHDEIIAEPPASGGQATFLIMRHIMSHGPAWAKGLPLDGAGYVSQRYAKG